MVEFSRGYINDFIHTQEGNAVRKKNVRTAVTLVQLQFN